MATDIPICACGGPISNNQSTMTQPKAEYLHLKVDDAFSLLPMIGKDIKELDIPKEAIKYLGSSPFMVYYDTTFMGQPVSSASLSFITDYQNNAYLVNKAYITITKPNFNQAITFLESKFGECYYSDILPYVAVNGGAVTYYTYFKDGYRYHLSIGSAHKYYTLEISKAEPTTPPNRRANGFGAFPQGISMSPLSNRMNMTPPTPTPNENVEYWNCTNCGAMKNKGKFCTECGTKRPK